MASRGLANGSSTANVNWFSKFSAPPVSFGGVFLFGYGEYEDKSCDCRRFRLLGRGTRATSAWASASGTGGGHFPAIRGQKYRPGFSAIRQSCSRENIKLHYA